MGGPGSDDVEALVRAAHPDPSSILGPHPLPGGGLRIVAFLPNAASVEVWPLAGDPSALRMARIHDAGLFEAIYSDRHTPFPYRLVVTGLDGENNEIDDPYAFPALLGELDLFLLGEGTQTAAYTLLGAHPREVQGTQGVHFAVWAPHALWVGVIGDFNSWDGRRHPMRRRNEGGIWELFLPGLAPGSRYKYHIHSLSDGYVVDKADPYAFTAELRPGTASIVAALDGFPWQDQAWLERRAGSNLLNEPLLIYEVHLGSWRRTPDGSFPNYRDLAHQLVDYVREMGYTHIELMPITEHPTDESWGYLTTGYYAPTSRFGSPQDFMYLIDHCHRHGIGVFMDWVPSHFAKEGHGLGFFDGAHEYEHADPRQGEHLDWGSYVFNYGRGEVRGFLLSNALFWIDRYHIDGFRVDAVASMLYLDHQRPAGEWVANERGGRENLEAVAFLRRMNELVHERFPGVVTMAEESTTWPMVSRPVYLGGLGFTMKWNMGWMHDTLEYFATDPAHRRFIHNTMTFSITYAYTENYLLPLSHDEVVHGKSPLVYKAPGDEWRKFASLRLLLGGMWAHPGKKLLFMGADFGQTVEWDFNSSLRWDLLAYESHQGIRRWVQALNALYSGHPELWALDYDPAGFAWIDCKDVDNSVLVLIRRGLTRPELMPAQPDIPAPPPSERRDTPASEGLAQVLARQATAAAVTLRRQALDLTRPFLIVACNYTPIARQGYQIGVPLPGIYREVLCSDDRRFGGSGVINEGVFVSAPLPLHGYDQSITFTLSPLGVSVFELADF